MRTVEPDAQIVVRLATLPEDGPNAGLFKLMGLYRGSSDFSGSRVISLVESHRKIQP